MTPNICFQMIVYNDPYVLEPALETITEFGPIVVTQGPCGYWKQIGKKASGEETMDILAKYVPSHMQVDGQFDEKDEMVNASIHLVPPGTEFIWAVDADEVHDPENIQRILSLLETGEWDSVGFSTWSFFGGFDRILLGFERNAEFIRIQRFYDGATWATHRPPTILNPQTGAAWHKERHYSHVQTAANQLDYYHYSYTFPGRVYQNDRYYNGYCPDYLIPNYFHKVYLPWVLADPLERRQIELEYKGVHNWKPKRRGACFTCSWDGAHPESIASRMQELQARLDREVAFYKGVGEPCVSL